MGTKKEIDPRVWKLPRWAQMLIIDLERRVERAEADKLAAISQHPGTNVQRVEGMDHVDLPPDSKVRFRLGPHFGDWIEASIAVEGDDPPGLSVRGGDLFAVEPRAWNSIHVSLPRMGKK